MTPAWVHEPPFLVALVVVIIVISAYVARLFRSSFGPVWGPRLLVAGAFVIVLAVLILMKTAMP